MRQRSIWIKVSIAYQQNRKVKKKNKNPNAFTDYSQTIEKIYENLEDCHPTRKRKMLIVFDNMIEGMEAN